MDLDLYRQEIVENPYPSYELFREEGRCVRNDAMGAWIVTGYDDVRAVLHDPQHFTSGIIGDPAHDSTGIFALAPVIIAVDPPEHTRLRAVVREVFTPASIDRWIPRVEALVTELLSADEFVDQRASGGPIDILATFADPLPTLVIAEMMGVPPSDRQMFKEWSHALVNGAFAGEGGDLKTRELVTAGRAASDAMNDYFRSHIARCTRDPGDDLISMMVLANADGVMSEDELLVSCKLFITAGNETTTKLLANGILALAAHPDQRRRLAQEPVLLNSAVEEVFRFDGPVQFIPRGARDGARIGDTVIPDGDPVWAFLGAAHRDEGTFTGASTFDIARRPNPHLGLGHGVHLCLGAHLARLEGRIALQRLVASMPDFDVAQVEYAPALAVRGPCALKIGELQRV